MTTAVSQATELNFAEHVNVLNLRTYLLLVLLNQDIPTPLAERVISQDIFTPAKSVATLPKTLLDLQKSLRPTSFIVANLGDVVPSSETKADYSAQFARANSMEQLKEAQRSSKACTLALPPPWPDHALVETLCQGEKVVSQNCAA